MLQLSYLEDLDNLTEVERPVLVLKWVGEGREEERVETEERLGTKEVKDEVLTKKYCHPQKSQEG